MRLETEKLIIREYTMEDARANRVSTLAQGSLIQYSVYMTRDQRAAKTIRDLVRHYDGQVTLFRGTMVE